MKVLLPNSETSARFHSEIKKIEYWQPVVPSKNSDQCDFSSNSFWLGNSYGSKVWALKVEYDELGNIENFSNPNIVVALIDPPNRDVDSIVEVLLRVYSAISTDRSNTDTQKLKNIITNVKFPHYEYVSDYLPSPIPSWGNLPCKLAVSFQISEGAYVNDSTVANYRRNNFHDALEVLFAPRQDGILIGYELYTRETAPLLTWEVDWPLLRRGKEAPSERSRTKDDHSWENETDNTLAYVYQQLVNNSLWTPPYYGEPTVRLCAGGISPEDAISNWKHCATTFRTIIKSFQSDPDQ